MTLRVNRFPIDCAYNLLQTLKIKTYNCNAKRPHMNALPVSDREGDSEDHFDCSPEILSEIRVLVCEHSHTQALLLRRFLQEAGYSVDIVNSGTDALQHLHKTNPDIFITGIEVGDINGLELCWTIKTTPELDHIYTMILTASKDTTRTIESLDAGADDYVTKPFEKSELQARLRAASRIIRMQKTLRNLAEKDALTGAFNRRKFMAEITGECQRFERTRKPFHVIMMDIDHFKTINDSYGHQVGDEALIATVNCLHTTTRPYDTVGRLGGEEFAILLPHTDREASIALADRLRRGIAKIQIDTDQGELSFTASFGVSCVLDGPNCPDDLLNRADQCLYEAKESGRNRVISACNSAVPALD